MQDWVLTGRLAIHVTGDSGISQSLSIGHIAEGMLVERRFPKPALILLVGFCWGNPEKAKVGNVIVSRHIVSLNAARMTSSGIERKERRVQSSLDLPQEFVSALGQALAPLEITVLDGTLGSMEMLYQGTEGRDALIGQFPDLLGGEMEAFAFLQPQFSMADREGCLGPWRRRSRSQSTEGSSQQSCSDDHAIGNKSWPSRHFTGKGKRCTSDTPGRYRHRQCRER